MKVNINICLVILALFSVNKSIAQFDGGNGDGFSQSSYAQAFHENFIFLGGDGDGLGYASVIDVPLPIVLINFIAYKQGNWVNLEWQTASEINNDYFTIEKSKTLNNWIAINKIKGAGHSTSTLTYKTIDQTPYLGISYYRLKQTDFDGVYEYSKTRVVNFEQNTAEVVIYPNPANKQINIQASERELSSIRIYNNLGHDVSNQTEQLLKTNNIVIIGLSRLAPGIYTLKTRTTSNKVSIE